MVECWLPQKAFFISSCSVSSLCISHRRNDQQIPLSNFPQTLSYAVTTNHNHHMSLYTMLIKLVLYSLFSQIYQKFPECNLIVVGNFNLPGINWRTNSVLQRSPYKSLQEQVLNRFFENRLVQMIKEPTHIHGNVLDLLLINNTNIVESTSYLFWARQSLHYNSCTKNMYHH